MSVLYTLIRSRRRTASIEIRPDGEVVVRVPLRMPQMLIDDMVAEKSEWIHRHTAHRQAQRRPVLTDHELTALKNAAKTDIVARVERYAPLLGVTYGHITIRSQRTLWGSCSAKGNLNFNCLLMLTPDEIRDYVVIHELCHRCEMNHSPRFWETVSQLDEHWREHRQWLKTHSAELLSQLPCDKPSRQ